MIVARRYSLAAPIAKRVEAMANRYSQLSLLLTALLFVTAIILVVSGQSGGKWLISESDLITLAVFLCQE